MSCNVCFRSGKTIPIRPAQAAAIRKLLTVAGGPALFYSHDTLTIRLADVVALEGDVAH